MNDNISLGESSVSVAGPQPELFPGLTLLLRPEIDKVIAVDERIEPGLYHHIWRHHFISRRAASDSINEHNAEFDAALKEGREPWRPIIQVNDSRLIHTLEAVFEKPDGSGILLKVPPSIRTDSYKKMSEAFNGLLPVEVETTGRINYEKYLGAFAAGRYPMSRSNGLIDGKSEYNFYHDRVLNDHLLGALVLPPLVKVLIAQAAKTHLDAGNADICAVYDSLTSDNRSRIWDINSGIESGSMNALYVKLLGGSKPLSSNLHSMYFFKNLAEIIDRKVTISEKAAIKQQTIAAVRTLRNDPEMPLEGLREVQIATMPREYVNEYNLDTGLLAA